MMLAWVCAYHQGKLGSLSGSSASSGARLGYIGVLG